MNVSDFENHLKQLPGTTSNNAWGYTLFFYGTEQMLPFASLIDADTEQDNISGLDREGVFRINIGVSAATFKKLFPEERKDMDYRELNVFQPHPHYAAQKFICILSPSGEKLDQTLAFIDEAYELAKGRAERKGTA